MKKIKIVLFTFIFTFLFQGVVLANSGGIFARLTSSRKIAVIMYHMISENPEHINTYCISPEELEKDILYLKNKGYMFSSVSELDKNAKMFPDKNIAVLTFDDGYFSDYKYVLPLLEKHQVKASFFVFASMLEKPYYMTKSQLKELANSEYSEIGNHSYDIHNKDLEDIVELYSNMENSEMIIKDFSKNKQELEKITGKTITSLSYPNGIYNNFVDSVLKQRGICTVTLSTRETKYLTFNKQTVLGRYNRSNLRNVQQILDNFIK